MTRVDPKDWTPQGVSVLEDGAWEALREVEGSVCVTAGAGAGKTEFLAQKADYLLRTGICKAPKRILAISFKRDAAATLAERVRRRSGPDLARRFVSMTFDAFSKSLVDQFRMALPAMYRPPVNYRIAFPKDRDFQEFLRSAGMRGVNSDQFQRAFLLRRLQDLTQEVPDRFIDLLEQYWPHQFSSGPEPLLTFPMINRLAEYLLRTNARLRRSVRASYPFVFLDEFQDAQQAQFELLTTGFDPVRTKFTAVGDQKQRIMGWAGAMNDSFSALRKTFDARPIPLVRNWRTHDDLVAVQQLIAVHLDPAAPNVVAQAARTVDGSVAAIWQFDSAEEEIADVAAWIADQVESGKAPPHEIAILVRSRADRTEEDLAPALATHDIQLRNLARNLGDISIEEILTEDFTAILMPFIKLGSSRRNPEAWSDAVAIMRSISQILDEDDVGLARLNDRVELTIRAVRAFMATAPAEKAAAELTSLLVNTIGEAEIRRSSPTYQRDLDYRRVRVGFELLLAESASGVGDWGAVVERFTGKNQVSLLTVHKSKGMEFHTIVFLGFDNRTWWSLTPESTEELNSFFVALTRAKQRAFFTSCSDRGRPIAWLEELLGDLLPRVSGTSK